jgi:hypothetical protein
MFSVAESIKCMQDYLRSGKTLAQFESEHGIAGKTDGNHLILDYDQFTVKWNEPYGYACRGLVVDPVTFEVIAFGLPKFHNLGEHYASSIDWASARVFEKIDGTMINRWWSPVTQRFEYTTRFCLPDGLETTKVNSGAMHWADMIRRCMASVSADVLALQSKKETWTFEVCSFHNMVVVRHAGFYAKLLAVRNIETLQEQSVADRDFAPSYYRFSNADEVAAFANKHPATELEGFVVVDSSFNRIKIKSDQYVSLHRLKDGLRGINNLVMLAKGNDYEEVTSHFPEYKPDLDMAASIINAVIHKHEQAYASASMIDNQKDFAIEINSKGLECSAALFAVRAGRAISIDAAFRHMPDTAFCKIFKSKIANALSNSYSDSKPLS